MMVFALLFGSAMAREDGWRVDTPRFRPGNFNRRDDDIFAGAVVHAVLAVPEESTAVPPAGLQALD